MQKSIKAISAILSVSFAVSSCSTGPNTEIPKVYGKIYVVDTELGMACRINDDGARECKHFTDSYFRGSVALPRETRDEVFGLLPRCRDWGPAEKELVSEFMKRNQIIGEAL